MIKRLVMDSQRPVWGDQNGDQFLEDYKTSYGQLTDQFWMIRDRFWKIKDQFLKIRDQFLDDQKPGLDNQKIIIICLKLVIKF